MNLSGYVETLQEQLAVAAAAGGEDTRALAERLTASLDSATRLVLLDALSAAAGEITRDMAPGSVDLRLRNREPSFVVTLPPPVEAAAPEEPEPQPQPQPQNEPEPATREAPTPDEGDAAMVRINLRLPEHLKARVEDAAGQAGLSVNSWLVRAATAALDPGTQALGPVPGPGPGQARRAAREARRTATSGQHFTGWVR
jgi:hypothetical protein